MISAMITGVLKRWVQNVQEFTFLLVDSVRHAFTPPRYLVDTIMQMDSIGFGSLPIVVLIGFFTGGILALQAYREMSVFGAVGLMGEMVALALVLELGPVLTALMMAGRNSTGMASEIGSMVVSEQVDAMRALGTDPLRKLVIPRLLATVVTLPLLTILADFCGLLGGYFVSYLTVRLTTVQYWTSAYQSLSYKDLFQGLLKPFMFAIIISMMGCFEGLRTTGGTEGVGRATTRAMVVASVLIIVTDFFITKFLMAIGFY
jgi:phospholipid/cholesterol/gamma-HCH transport system permease protein